MEDVKPVHISGTKKKEYLKAKIDEFEGINDFKKGYQPRTIIVKDGKGDFFTDSHSILARWKNHFSQIVNIHGVNDVRQTQICTAEPLVPLRLSWLLKS
jgi:hypothetical protein